MASDGVMYRPSESLDSLREQLQVVCNLHIVLLRNLRDFKNLRHGFIEEAAYRGTQISKTECAEASVCTVNLHAGISAQLTAT